MVEVVGDPVVGEPARRTGPDHGRVLRLEHRGQAGQPALDHLLVDDVGLVEAGLGPGGVDVVDLDDHGRGGQLGGAGGWSRPVRGGRPVGGPGRRGGGRDRRRGGRSGRQLQRQLGVRRTGGGRGAAATATARPPGTPRPSRRPASLPAGPAGPGFGDAVVSSRPFRHSSRSASTRSRRVRRPRPGAAAGAGVRQPQLGHRAPGWPATAAPLASTFSSAEARAGGYRVSATAAWSASGVPVVGAQRDDPADPEGGHQHGGRQCLVVADLDQLLGQHRLQLDAVQLGQQPGSDPDASARPGRVPAAMAFRPGLSMTTQAGLAQPGADAERLPPGSTAGRRVTGSASRPPTAPGPCGPRQSEPRRPGRRHDHQHHHARHGPGRQQGDDAEPRPPARRRTRPPPGGPAAASRAGPGHQGSHGRGRGRPADEAATAGRRSAPAARRPVPAPGFVVEVQVPLGQALQRKTGRPLLAARHQSARNGPPASARSRARGQGDGVAGRDKEGVPVRAGHVPVADEVAGARPECRPPCPPGGSPRSSLRAARGRTARRRPGSAGSSPVR